MEERMYEDSWLLFKNVTTQSKFFVEFDEDFFPTLRREGTEQTIDLVDLIEVPDVIEGEGVLVTLGVVTEAMSMILKGTIGLELRFEKATDQEGNEIPEVNRYMEHHDDLPGHSEAFLVGRLRRIDYILVTASS